MTLIDDHAPVTDLLEDVPPLSRKQRRAIARSTQRVNLLDGSIRAGKTFSWLIKWFVFIAVQAPPRGALIMVGQTRESVYRNVFEPIDNDPTLAVFRPFITYKQGAPTATMFGRTVHIMGASDVRAERKLRGMTVAGAFVDEVTTLTQDFFRQLLGRMSVKGAQMFATTNPDAPRHWLKVEYLNRLHELPDWYVEHFTMRDNPGLGAEYIESLEREYSGVWYDRFILGLWVAAEGAVYPEFDGNVHVRPPASFPPMDEILIAGMDYGTTHSTRAYLIGMAIRPEPRLYVLSEFAPATATVGQHAAMYRAWLASQPVERWRFPTWHAVDPAAAVMRQQLFDDGLSNTIRAHNAVIPGIQTISSLLAAGRLIVSSECTQLIDGLPGYRWDSAASARGETRPIKEDDDEVDALRYAVYTSRRYWRGHIPLAAAMRSETIDETELDSAPA